LVSKKYKEDILNLQTIQERISENAMWLHAMACTLSKLDYQIKENRSGVEFELDKSAALYFLGLAEFSIKENLRALIENADKSMRIAASAALKHNDTLSNRDFVIPMISPNAKDTGRVNQLQYIKQFPGDEYKKF